MLFDQLEKEGVDPKEFQRVSIPSGFDIGSDTPEEIAVSIAAELIAARKKLNIGPPRDSLRDARKSGARGN